jgi:hypothetical protein
LLVPLLGSDIKHLTMFSSGALSRVVHGGNPHDSNTDLVVPQELGL